MTNLQFTILDHKAQAHSIPFFAPTVEVAERHFTDLSNDLDTSIGRYPADFTLYLVGTFNQDTADVEPIRPKQHIGNALDYVNKPRLVEAPATTAMPTEA